ncbi:hypothetical protein G9F72_019145 [Clostridium estertheticum]|nr:hypothetical protein [Clostridium estertheticum]MBZ9688449.1 hypothetical protein [Clostridium estertheticum]
MDTFEQLLKIQRQLEDYKNLVASVKNTEMYDYSVVVLQGAHQQLATAS